MMSTLAAQPRLRSLVLLAAGLAWSCQPLPEGKFFAAAIELVIAGPPPDMLWPGGETCHVAGDPMFVLFKEMSGNGVSPSIKDVNVAAARSGRFDAEADTCTFRVFLRWKFGPRYVVVATNGADWLTRCDQSLQFFVIPPARHVIRFAVGDEGCTTEILPEG